MELMPNRVSRAYETRVSFASLRTDPLQREGGLDGSGHRASSAGRRSSISSAPFDTESV